MPFNLTLRRQVYLSTIVLIILLKCIVHLTWENKPDKHKPNLTLVNEVNQIPRRRVPSFCLSPSHMALDFQSVPSAFDFQYIPSTSQVCNETKLRQILEQFPTSYPCQNYTKCHSCPPYNLQYKHVEVFEAKIFLNLLRNKILSITGDSLGLQFYQGLIISLSHEEHESIEGNTTSITEDGTDNGYYRVDSHAQVTVWNAYNATIWWCRNDMMLLYGINHYNFCGKQLIQSNFLILAFGAWFKPGFQINYENDTSRTFLESLEQYENLLPLIRQYYIERNPNLKLFWRLHPYANTDTLYGVVTPPQSSNGWPPHKISNISTWVLAQNKVLRNFLTYYPNDIILDWYSLSLYTIDFEKEIGRNRSLIKDNLHYCVEGLPHQAPLLLQISMNNMLSSVSNDSVMIINL